jgi:hypothetical protein
MSDFEMSFKIGKCFDELARAFARLGVNRPLHTETPNQACEKSFDGTHRLERKMCDIVCNAPCEAMTFFAQECREVNMRQDELSPLNIFIEASALGREHAHTSPRLITGKNEETDEERKGA